MANFAEDIEQAAKGEPILGIVFEDSRDWDEYRWWAGLAPDVLMTWEQVRPLCDREYSTDFGAQECPDFCAWTPTRVLFIHEYDGSTYVRTVPRNPQFDGERRIGKLDPDSKTNGLRAEEASTK
jgi:hypothetical protein